MAEVVRYVDPDASGSGDGTSWTDAYTSLSAWESGEATDLVTDGDWHHVYCRASSGTADTTALTIDGWTTGASNYILIEAADGDEAQKDGWDTSRYRLNVTNTDAITNRESYVRFTGLQIKATGTQDFLINAAYWDTGTSDIRIDSCRLESDGDTSGLIGIKAYDGGSNPTITIINCVFHDVMRAIDITHGTYKIYNNIIRGTGVASNGHFGIWLQLNTHTAVIKNNAIFNNYDDIRDDSSGTITIDYNASDDGDGTNDVSPDSSDWDNEFEDPANGDFTLLNTGNLHEAGVGPGTDSDVPSTDIDGDSRNGNSCDIGADEYTSGGTAYTTDLSDTVGVTDTIATKIEYILSISESVGVTDTIATAIAKAVTMADTVGLTDALTTTVEAFVTVSLADDVGITDVTSIVGTFIREVQETVGVTDTTALVGTYIRTVADAVGVTDALQASVGLIISLSDTIDVTDALTAAIIILSEREIITADSLINAGIDEASAITAIARANSIISSEINGTGAI